MQTLKQIVKELNKKREDTLQAVGEVIGLAADAGAMIAQARSDGKDVAELLGAAGLTDEQGKRLERVAANRHKLKTGEPAVVRQVMLWAEMLPDPITVSVASERKPFLWPIIKVSQWLSNRSKHQAWNQQTKAEFVRYAEPIALKYREIKEAGLE